MNLDMSCYNTLPFHDRVQVLENSAVFISYYVTKDTTTTLYFYNRYYIEMIVDHATNNLLDVIAFNDSTRLLKYLADITIDDLVTASE
jgi:hypothetical protein